MKSDGPLHPKNNRLVPTSLPIDANLARSLRNPRKGARPDPDAIRIIGCFGTVGRRNFEGRICEMRVIFGGVVEGDGGRFDGGGGRVL